MNEDYLKLTSDFGERHRAGGVFTADALLDLYGRSEVAASILLRGTEGYGLRQHLRSDRSLTLSEDLPLVAVPSTGSSAKPLPDPSAAYDASADTTPKPRTKPARKTP